MKRTLRRAPNVYHFKRTVKLTNIPSNTAGVLSGFSFAFNQLPNVAEFTNLFDCYRINKIVFKLVPTASDDPIGGSYIIPQTHTVLDYNDAAAPASLAALYEYQNWRMKRGTYIHTRAFVPATLDATTTSGAIAGTNPKYKQWLNCANADVPHFGLKLGIDPSTTNGDINWDPYVTYYFSCKAVC